MLFWLNFTQKSAAMTSRYRIMIYGMVTGWGLKLQNMIVAKKIHVNGSVSEQVDGLDIHIEGDLSRLNDFVDWCSKGPIASKTETMTICEESISYYDDFSIK